MVSGPCKSSSWSTFNLWVPSIIYNNPGTTGQVTSEGDACHLKPSRWGRWRQRHALASVKHTWRNRYRPYPCQDDRPPSQFPGEPTVTFGCKLNSFELSIDSVYLINSTTRKYVLSALILILRCYKSERTRWPSAHIPNFKKGMWPFSWWKQF